jgi:D-alanine-D-alanine ligase
MKKVAVFFGGISPEHEVSIITGVQLMKSVDTSKYDLIPVYIDKKGHWWTGSDLTSMDWYKSQDLMKPKGASPFSISLNHGENDIDAAILCFHGQYGEGGNIQGALELAGIPYQGPAVTSAAICFDKIVLRQILSAENVSQTAYTWFTKQQWQDDKQTVLDKINGLEFPVFIKPANGGSTIGIQRAKEAKNVAELVEVVLHYDDRVLVEAEVKDCIEINISVLGYEGNVKTSTPEQPIKQDDFLSFADKYERGGGKKNGMASATRRIPAPISNSLTQKVQAEAKRVFELLDCTGVIRIDFFVNPSTEEIFVIEPNTIPGSMSFYLWEATGIEYPELVDRLVEIAETVAKKKQEITTTFNSSIIEKSGD